MAFTDYSSLTTSHLIHWNRRPNGAFLPCRCIDQVNFRNTVSRYSLSICSSSDDAAMVIDEIAVAKEIMAESRSEILRMKESIGAVPGLAIILVGDKTFSGVYEAACLYVGIKSSVVRLAQYSSEEEVLKSVSRFNSDPCVHGILVESDLPSYMDPKKILNEVRVEKDVDGFHPQNYGLLAMRETGPLCFPRAPKACIELLHRYKFEIKGKRAVVIGRSDIFGIPVALLLQREDETVTIIHSRTKNPEEITRQADIIISAAGKPNMVRGSWIKPGAVIINIGFDFVQDPNAPHGFRKVGDICYEEVCKVASAINLVEEGVGLMTLAMLLSNTLTSAKRIHNFI